MPKKQPRNAYYYFMMDFREEQRKKGIHYENLKEVQEVADPSWRSAPASVRAKYTELAKREKEKVKGSDKKYTSNGVCVADIEAMNRIKQEIHDSELEYISNFVKSKIFNKAIYQEDIYLIDVNAYCSTGEHFLMAESTVLRFNLADGIRDLYHEMINPGRIPVGYMSNVKLGAMEFGVDMPNEETKQTDYLIVLANIMDYLKQNFKSGSHLPPLYTIPEKVEQVQDFILQMCMFAGEDETQIRVYKLDNLLFHLANEIKTHADEGYPKITLATGLLKKDLFKYTPKLACEHHEKIDKGVECTSSRVKRWAFTIMDKCCPVAGIEAIPGKHIPKGIDIEGVLSYKEQKQEELYPLDVKSLASSSCYSSVVNESLDSASNAGSEKPKPKRTHQPLRMPKTDFSRAIRPAPELNEANFPTLVSGRGRGLARCFNKLDLDK